MQEKKKDSLFKTLIRSFLITLVILAIFVALGMGFGAIGIPMWPFVFFLFYFMSIAGMDRSKLWPIAIGGILGIFTGLSNGIITELTGSAAIGMAVFLVLVIGLIMMVVMGTVPVVNALTMLLLTATSSFTNMKPGDWAGLAAGAPGYETMTMGGAFLRILLSYALSVALFAVITAVMANNARKVGDGAPILEPHAPPLESNE